MNDVRVDEAGDFRCWKCGGKQFVSKRTFAAKATVGVGALLTHKKLKCQTCGEYNQTGTARPYVGPGKVLPIEKHPIQLGKALAKAERLGPAYAEWKAQHPEGPPS